jgi:uncharacterized protein DUF2304
VDVTRLVSLLLSGSILTLVIWLIRAGRLREKYALLWLFTCIVIILLAASRRLLETTAIAVGIYYPPSLLFLLGLLFLLLVNIGYAVSLSRLSVSSHKLAQEVALLKQELEEAKLAAQSPKKDPDDPQGV